MNSLADRSGRRWRSRASPRPPGPGLPKLVSGMIAARNLPGFYEWAGARYDTRWLLRLPERDWLLTSEPEDARALMAAGPEVASGGEANASLIPIGGRNSVVALDGAAHLDARRVLLPSFHGDRMRMYLRDMEKLTDEMIDGWSGGEVINLYAAARRLTFRIIVRTVLGIRDPNRAEETLSRVQKLFGGVAIVIHVPALQRDFGPLSPWRRFLALRARADEVIYAELRARRTARDVDDRDDVLSRLLHARHDDGSPLSDQELRDHVMTLLLAGHENTAAAIAWIVDLLLRHQDVLRSLRGELQANGDAYLDAVIREGLRYRPPVPMFGRVTAGPLELGPYTIPPGVGVLINIWSLHRRPDLFRDPGLFRPERFLEGDPPPYSYLPFGGGSRRCLGASFGEQELRVVIRQLVSRCELQLVTQRPEGFRLRGVTLVPSRGVRVRVKPRA